MTLDQIEGNEPIHENWGEETGEDIDEVRSICIQALLCFQRLTNLLTMMMSVVLLFCCFCY